MGRSVSVPALPQRIVSLVPSQTELLFDLGVGERVVGVTRYCVHPAGEVAKKEVVGGTKTLRFDIIERLEPDLIIGNMEENERGAIERLEIDYPVWMSDVRDLVGAIRMIRSVGGVVDRASEAEKIAADVELAFDALPRLPNALRVAYVIWRKPHMVAGRPTFIDAMLTICGFENAFGAQTLPAESALAGDLSASDKPAGPMSVQLAGDSRYPVVNDDQLRTSGLDLILLASEPFPFDEVYRAEFAEKFPGVNVRLVDGEMFSWYGSRLVRAAKYLRHLVADLADGRQLDKD